VLHNHLLLLLHLLQLQCSSIAHCLLLQIAPRTTASRGFNGWKATHRGCRPLGRLQTSTCMHKTAQKQHDIEHMGEVTCVQYGSTLWDSPLGRLHTSTCTHNTQVHSRWLR
jgi:hypothetical protein